jgi:hypothetical protein
MWSDSTVWQYTKLSANDKRKRQATEACGFDAKAVLSKSNDFIHHNLIQCPRMTKRLWSQAIHLQKRKTKQRKGTWGKDKAIGKTVRKIFKKWVDSDREKGINRWDYTLQNFADRYPKLNLTDDAWYAQSSVKGGVSQIAKEVRLEAEKVQVSNWTLYSIDRLCFLSRI